MKLHEKGHDSIKENGGASNAVIRTAAPTRDYGVCTPTRWPKGPRSHYTATSLSSTVFSSLSQNQEALTANYVHTYTVAAPEKKSIGEVKIEQGLNSAWLTCRQIPPGPR